MPLFQNQFLKILCDFGAQSGVHWGACGATWSLKMRCQIPQTVFTLEGFWRFLLWAGGAAGGSVQRLRPRVFIDFYSAW